ncbi:MAG: sialidase family protein, partial [Akkermansiaceae bacterium]|nr:sialidase family protein [Akkermansiaceae bacterium]
MKLLFCTLFVALPLSLMAENKFEGRLEPFLGKPKMESQQVFEGSRFPNVAVATDGTILAVFAQNGVSVRRSEDGGTTWGDPIG